jgi:hypothetical protein
VFSWAIFRGFNGPVMGTACGTRIARARVACVTKVRKFLQEADKQVPLLVKKRGNTTRKNDQ